MDRPDLFSEVNEITKENAILFLNTYASQIKWNKSGGCIIDLGCGDGSVTCILKKYVPENYEKFYACDINKKMVEYANHNHGHENIKFIVQDAAGELSDELRSAFDNVFSFFLFHWISNQEKGFLNVYELLKKGGECFLVFFASMEVYLAYEIMARTPKWTPWLNKLDTFISPYHNMQDPEEKIKLMMEKIGFNHINVESKNLKHTRKNSLEFKRILRAVDPHDLPEDVFDEFYIDLFKTGQNLGFVDENIDSEDQSREITYGFTLIVIHASKPL